MTYQIPGFSTPTSPKAAARLFVNYGVRAEIPVKGVRFGASCRLLISKNFGGPTRAELLCDPKRLAIMSRMVDGKEQLYVVLDPKRFRMPPGDYFIDVTDSDVPVFSSFITVGPKTVANDCTVRLNSAGESQVVVDSTDPTNMNQNISFNSESPVIAGTYVGGRYKWPYQAQLISAIVDCVPPTTGSVIFTLEVGGVPLSRSLEIAAGSNGNAELSLVGVTVPAGAYVRWKCAQAPIAEESAYQVYITVNANLS